tara:strand:- start:986 stop:1306 length:321 start_codon:yes stop_codon:yes gene_type:complete
VWYVGGVLMQLWETLLWETLLWKNYKCKLISKIATINKLIQPLLWLLILCIPGYIKKHKINVKMIFVTLVVYIFFVSQFFKNDYGCITPFNISNADYYKKLIIKIM